MKMTYLKIKNCRECGGTGAILCKTVECGKYGARVKMVCIQCKDKTCKRPSVYIEIDTIENVNKAITTWNTSS